MKNLYARVLNYLLYLACCLLTGTGLAMAYRLPRGRTGRGLELLGQGRHDWAAVHLWAAWAAIALIVLHLYFNRAWLRKIASSGRGWLLLASVGAGVAVVALFWLAPVRDTLAGG